MITSSFLAIAFSTADFASSLTSFLRNASLANTFVTSASEVTCVNSFLASFTSSVCFTSDFAFSSAFSASSFLFFPAASDSTTTVLSAVSVATLVFTSSWVASTFANTSFSFTNSSRADFNATSSAFLTEAKLTSNFSITVLSSVLSTAFTSDFAVSSLACSAWTLAATESTTLSLVCSTFLTSLAGSNTFSFSPAFVVLFDVVLFDTSSAAWVTPPTPKKMLAPITTEAAPTLNFLIEYDSTFVPCLASFKYWLFLPIIFSSKLSFHYQVAINYTKNYNENNYLIMFI